MSRSIPLFRPYSDPHVEAAMLRVLRSGAIAAGEDAVRFEAVFAAAIARPHTLLVSDMSMALTMALRLAGAGSGTEVIASPFACMSSNAPLALSGATVRWADLDPQTGAMNVGDVASLIGPRTRAVVLHHLAGYPGPADALAELCRSSGIALIEDCNTAFGATLQGRAVGSFGDFGVYSFYPNRQINGLEGGALSCRDEETRARAVRLRRFGIDLTRFRDSAGEIDPALDVPEIGWSGTMSNLHAAAALPQMASLPQRQARTEHVAGRLTQELGDVEGIRPLLLLPGAQSAYWTFGVRVGRPTAVLRALKQSGIGASALHLRTDRYSGFAGDRRHLPGVESYVETALHLPCGWWLSDDDVDYLIAKVRQAVRMHAEPIA